MQLSQFLSNPLKFNLRCFRISQSLILLCPFHNSLGNSISNSKSAQTTTSERLQFPDDLKYNGAPISPDIILNIINPDSKGGESTNVDCDCSILSECWDESFQDTHAHILSKVKIFRFDAFNNLVRIDIEFIQEISKNGIIERI